MKSEVVSFCVVSPIPLRVCLAGSMDAADVISSIKCGKHGKWLIHLLSSL